MQPRLTTPLESVVLEKPQKSKGKKLFTFLLVCMVLVTVFALGGMYLSHTGISWDELYERLFSNRAISQDVPPPEEPKNDTKTSEKAEENDGFVITKNLSGSKEVNDTTGKAVLSQIDGTDFSDPAVYSAEVPTVLVVCTHPTQSYSEIKEKDPRQSVGDVIYSTDPEKNVSAVAGAFCEVLREAGIFALFAVPAVEEESTLGDTERTERLIAETLEKYPSIRYVIDVQRGLFLSEDGSIVRACNEAGQAQIFPEAVMERCGEESLLLARRIRNELNGTNSEICGSVDFVSDPLTKEIPVPFLRFRAGCIGNSLAEGIESGRMLAKSFIGVFGEPLPQNAS